MSKTDNRKISKHVKLNNILLNNSWVKEEVNMKKNKNEMFMEVKIKIQHIKV